MKLLKSILQHKCPRCRKGDLYIQPFQFSNPLNMHEKCSHCDLKFEAEPGYFFGAMFISYIWTGFFFLFIVGLGLMVFHWSVNQTFLVLILIAAVLYFWIARISRSIYIHLDIRYDAAFGDEK